MHHKAININSKIHDYAIKWTDFEDDNFHQAIEVSQAIIIDSKVYDLYSDRYFFARSMFGSLLS